VFVVELLFKGTRENPLLINISKQFVGQVGCKAWLFVASSLSLGRLFVVLFLDKTVEG